jgi:heterodisulfide reductase subunit B
MGCYSSFKLGKYNLKNDKLKGNIERAAGVKYGENIRKIDVIHPLTDLNNHIDLIKEKLKRKAEGLKAVCYYGCLFTRPPKAAEVEDFEDPREMDNLLKIMGIDVLNWNSKTKCCGAAYSITNPEISFEVCNRILNDAKDAGSDVIVVACPLCQSNLDMRQKQIESKFNEKFNIPVIYITQLLGLALGASYEEVGLDKEFVNAKNVICEKLKI